jgi:hypothetical protein
MSRQQLNQTKFKSRSRPGYTSSRSLSRSKLRSRTRRITRKFGVNSPSPDRMTSEEKFYKFLPGIGDKVSEMRETILSWIRVVRIAHKDYDIKKKDLKDVLTKMKDLLEFEYLRENELAILAHRIGCPERKVSLKGISGLTKCMKTYTSQETLAKLDNYERNVRSSHIYHASFLIENIQNNFINIDIKVGELEKCLLDMVLLSYGPTRFRDVYEKIMTRAKRMPEKWIDMNLAKYHKIEDNFIQEFKVKVKRFRQ